MSDKSGKKGIFARINEALYETVEPAGQPEAPGTEEKSDREPPAGPAAMAEGQPVESTPDLAARVRAAIAGKGRPLDQFLALVTSFTEIIPEESGRYRAAMKALEKTGNLTRDQILQASGDQLLALQTQREVFTERASRKRDELKKQGSGAEAIRDQIAELQQTISRLQEQERGVLLEVAAEEGRIKAAEEGFAALLTTLETEIIGSREKIEKYIPR